MLIVLADGFEEIEAVTPIDILRRAGVEVIVAGVGKREVTGSHDITIETDLMIEQYQGLPDAIILPGGNPGALNLNKSEALKKLLDLMEREKKIIAAICAAPAVVLAPQGIIDGKKATCFPGYESVFGAKITFVEDRTIRDGQVITSRGAGTALEFSLEIAAQLVTPEKVQQVAKAVLYKP